MRTPALSPNMPSPHFPNQIKTHILPYQLLNNLEGHGTNSEEKKNPNHCYFKSKDDFKNHCMIPQGTWMWSVNSDRCIKLLSKSVQAVENTKELTICKYTFTLLAGVIFCLHKAVMVTGVWSFFFYFGGCVCVSAAELALFKKNGP